MKNLLAIIAIVTIMVVFLSSCKSHELCPAYGNKNYPSQEKHA